MDWVHCNNCYVQPGELEVKFFITNCGHIYCDNCLKSNTSEKCIVCQVKYASLPLSSNMNSEIEIYFHDPVISLKKQIKILEFQQNHRIRLLSYNKEKLKNFNQLEKENWALKEKLSLLKQENSYLKNEVKRLFELLNRRDDGFEDEKNHLNYSKSTPKIYPLNQLQSKRVEETIFTNLNLYKFNNKFREDNSKKNSSTDSNYFILSDSNKCAKKKGNSKTYTFPEFSGSSR